MIIVYIHRGYPEAWPLVGPDHFRMDWGDFYEIVEISALDEARTPYHFVCPD